MRERILQSWSRGNESSGTNSPPGFESEDKTVWPIAFIREVVSTSWSGIVVSRSDFRYAEISVSYPVLSLPGFSIPNVEFFRV